MTPFVEQAYAAAVDSAAFGKVLDPIIAHVVNPVIELMFVVAVIVFVYGVLQMVLHSNDAEAHKKGRMSILGGVAGMFIMMSAWGIIYLISNTIKGI